MSRCMHFRSDPGTGDVWVCRREVGHDGPCAAELIGEDATCGARQPGHALPCPLRSGHDGQHVMSPCGEWWRPAAGIAVPCGQYSGHAGQHRAEVCW